MSESNNVSKFPSWLKRSFGQLFIGLLVGIILIALTSYLTGFKFIQSINNTNSKLNLLFPKIENMDTTISDIKNKYTAEDKHGAGIKVGINNNLKDHTATLYIGNTDIHEGEIIQITNAKSIFHPKVRVMVIQKADRTNTNSEASLFISKKAAQLLDLEIFKGVFNLKFKRIKG